MLLSTRKNKEAPPLLVEAGDATRTWENSLAGFL